MYLIITKHLEDKRYRKKDPKEHLFQERILQPHTSKRKAFNLKECAINSNHQAFKLLSKGFFSLKLTPTINKSFIDSLFTLFRELLFLTTYCITVWLVTSFKGIKTRDKANPSLEIGLQAKDWLVFWVVVGDVGKLGSLRKRGGGLHGCNLKLF